MEIEFVWYVSKRAVVEWELSAPELLTPAVLVFKSAPRRAMGDRLTTHTVQYLCTLSCGVSGLGLAFLSSCSDTVAAHYTGNQQLHHTS